MISIYKTSITNKEEISCLEVGLNKIAGIINWNFDMEDIDKILRVESTTSKSKEVIHLLRQENFECKELF